MIFFFQILTVWWTFHRKDFKWEKNGVRGQFLKKNKFCKENLTKVWKQLPVAILQQAKTGAQSDATLIISYLLKV